jgi:transposase
MDRLPATTVDDLQQALDSIEAKTPALRLVAAIAYKHGVTQSELAEWFDVERKTIYNWFTRFEEEGLESAIRDKKRTGRPRKLTDEQLEELEVTLQHRPTAVGFDAPAWTTELLQAYIRERFGIDYSRSSCRRLLKEAGLRHRTARNAAAELDPDDRDAVERELQELGPIWLPH